MSVPPNDRENYCRLIGLNPMKENTYTYEAIEKKIAAKEKKWEKDSGDKQNDLERRFQIRAYYKMVPDMRKVMKDPILRSKEFDEGRKQLKAKASKLNKDSIVLHDGSRVLLPGTADSLVKKIQWDGITKEDLIAIAGIKKTSVPPVVNEKINSTYKGIREVDTDTPMELLNRIIQNPDLEIKLNPLRDGSSFTEIRSAFDVCEKRVSSVRHEILPDQDSYIQSLRALKIMLSADTDLSSLIKYGKCKKALAPAMQMMEEDYSQPFTREYIDNILNMFLKNTNVDKDMAIAILEEFCVKKKFIANFSTKESKLIICPNCSGLVEANGNAICCSICGFSIRTKCPQCNTEQSSGNSACIKCGFDFQSGLKKAQELEKRFKENLEAGFVNKADEDLKNIKKVYATYPNIDSLNQDLRNVSLKYDKAIKNIEQTYKYKKYCETKECCDNTLVDFPKLFDNNFELKKKYTDSLQRINDAEKLCKEAESTEDRQKIMAIYVSAAERCPDHPVARSKLSQFPPESPADASLQVRDGKILLKYAIPENRNGMTFCVYREQDKLPAVNEETIPLTELPGSVFLDKTAEPGIDYYYSVYSKRWGILSRESANCGPAIVFVEVENVTIEQMQGGLKINYEKPKGCTRVRIWRKEGTTEAGTGEELEITPQDGSTTIDDYGLKGDIKYHYLFVAEYKGKNKTERSMGSAFSCTTVKYPEPIRDMEIRWNKTDGSYTAKWKSKEKVVLYSSPKKVTMFGRNIPVSDLNSWMTEIKPIEVYDDGMKFMLSDGAVQYIYPMIPAGKIAIRGKDIMVANLKPFRDVEKRLSGKDCDLTMNWPTDAESAIIVVKDSSPALGPDDVNAEKITVSRNAYNTDKMVRISMGNSKKRVVTLYAVYDVSGDKMNSRGMSIDVYSGSCTKVKYTMSLDKSTKTESKVLISIDADYTVKELPQMTAICVNEGIPLKIWDGESVWTSNGPIALSAGKALITFHTKPKIDLSKIRMFFTNEDDYHLFRFIHPIYKDR